jgi:hypothetical protein
MKTWKSRILAVALALVASPLLATPQGASDQQSSPSSPPAASQPQTQVQPNQNALGRRHHRRHRRNNTSFLLRDPAVRERLGISAEQAAKIQAEQGEFTKAMIRDRADVQVKRLELRELLAAEKPDRTAIGQKLAQLNEVQFAMHKAVIEHHLAMREMFTPEQREKMRYMFREMRRGERFGPPDAPGEPGA